STEYTVTNDEDLVHKGYLDSVITGITTEDVLPAGTTLTPYLKWDGDSWEPSAITAADILPTMTDAQIIVANNTTPTAVSMSGDATIANTGAVTVTGLQGRAVHNVAPTDGQVLTWNNTDSRWEAAALPAGVTITGTPERLSRFNGTGDGIEDSVISVNTTGTMNIGGSDPEIEFGGNLMLHENGNNTV